jgi:mono/diheme cytochrome c family protein
MYRRAVCAALACGLALGAAGATSRHKPRSSGPSSAPFKATPSPARLARGQYLVEASAHCFVCHSQVDWAHGVEPKPGRRGGGSQFVEPMAFRLICSNVSPDRETGAGDWTDEQFARAIRDGIGIDGRRLFPVMPYMKYRVMSDEDLASIIVYLRSIPPVRRRLPKTEMPPLLKAALPEPPPVGHVKRVNLSDPVKRGEYLAALSNCSGCHTPMDQHGRPVPGLEFAGGRIMEGPWGTVASANITPDASGISYYNPETFRHLMRTGRVGARQVSEIMLWGVYRQLTDADLNAIFAYLRTLKPVAHRVDNTEPPTYCRLCRQKHGLGNRN